ncbi:MAG: GDP-mannose 4,6-dehydratase [Alphaproteobacteria bacterium]|nr:MAG: GDP-mannose 4,6-dehydratase [alpha proteobacterium MED-G09]|tara:strand:- start:578 stop:1612 length:1035 start_codon:yes stop_codon:yes gene_type:complete
MTKKALITGITGQDGAYLADFLLKKDYKVYGAVRRTSSINTARLSDIGVLDNIELVSMDLGEITNIQRVIEKIEPDEIYNLAAQSFVQTSYEQPIYTSDIDGIGVTRILESVRNLGGNPKFYQASTSEMFGKAHESPQNENTPFYPRSPYGVAKLYSHWMTVNYRESWGIHACSGILFNHESPLRGSEFVTRKISLGMAEIKNKKKDIIHLGNLSAERDWGFAGDYVEAMWLMMQKKEPTDYVIATGQTHSVRDFTEYAASAIGIDLEWNKKGQSEEGLCKKTGKIIISVDPAYNRPAETDHLLGDSSKAQKDLKWKPCINFESLVEMMVDHDLRRVEKGLVWF